MNFRCPKCGREEEILVDRSPQCLACRIPMVGASAYTGLWMSPRISIARMETTIGKHGCQRAIGSGEFKKEREAWTSGMFALGLMSMKGHERWVEIETVENTPDTKVHRIDQSTGHNCIETYHIEVVDWDEHVEDVMDVIRKKCRRAYPAFFFLLVLARNGKSIDLVRVHQEMKAMRVPFFEVWILGRAAETEIVMVRVVPGLVQIGFNIREALEKAKGQADFLEREKRGTSTEFRDRGLVYVPLP